MDCRSVPSGLVSFSADDPGLRRCSLRSSRLHAWAGSRGPPLQGSWGSLPGVKRTKRTSSPGRSGRANREPAQSWVRRPPLMSPERTLLKGRFSAEPQGENRPGDLPLDWRSVPSGLFSYSADDPGLRRSSLRSSRLHAWAGSRGPPLQGSWGSPPGVKRTKRTSRQPCSMISRLEGVLRKPCSRCPKVRNPGAQTSKWVTSQAVGPCHGRCQAWRTLRPKLP